MALVTSLNITDGSITQGKLAAGVTATVAAVSITRAMIVADAIDGTKLADNAVDSEHYTDVSIDTAHIGNLQVTTAKIAADAIDGTKLADNAVDSEHYTDGSIDNAHIADNAIDSEHYADVSIDTAHIGNLQVTTGKIAADAIDGTKLADNAVDSEHYAAASIDAEHYADGSITQAKLAAGVGQSGAADVLGISGLTANFYNVSLTSVNYTLSGAHRVISVDLNDQSQMWDLTQFRQLEQHTSWFVELGPMPTQMLIAIDSAQENVTIYNKKYMTPWMNFVIGGSGSGSRNQIGDDTILDMAFLDGQIYVGNGGDGLAVIDFVGDKTRRYFSGAFDLMKGSLDSRNAGLGNIGSMTSVGIVNGTVNAIAAIRDPEGEEDEFRRPEHIWAVGTDGGLSLNDAGVTDINDTTDVTDIDSLTMGSEGNLVYIDDEASRDSVKWIYRAQDELTDGIVPNNKWSATGDGSEDLPWADSAVLSDVAILERSSIADDQVSPIIVFSSDKGLAISHTKKNDNHNGLTFIVNNVGNWPPYSGTVGMSFALEDATELFGNDLTNNNTVTFSTTGVIGNCANFVAASSQSLTDADNAAHTPSLSALSVGCWFRREIDSGSTEGLVCKWDEGTTTDRTYRIDILGDDTVQFATRNDAANQVAITGPVVALNIWYHLVGTWDGTTQRLYLNGIEVSSGAQSGTLQGATENFTIAARSVGNVPASFFDGQIDDVFVMGKALSATEVKFIYNRGKHALRSSVNTNDALDSMDIARVTTDEDGQWIGVLDAAGKLTILDQFGIPYLEDSTSIGTVDDIAVWQLPGAKTPSYSMAGSTAIRVVQTNQLLDEI